MVKLKTHYNAHEFPKIYCKSSDEVMVERSGYISAKARIENLLLAGQRLADYRAEHYDFTGTAIDEDFEDPTRRPGYDMADAFQDKERIKQRIKARARDNKPEEPSQTEKSSKTEDSKESQ